MKKPFLFLTFFSVLLATQAMAISSLVTGNPKFLNYTANGSIKDVDIQVTPRGLYAEIAVVFSIQGAGSQTDSVESVLNFNLPENSFIHDSWLWLDANTIIVADIIERGLGTQIYNSIVQRRQDPSLLVKMTDNIYQLNVFPHLPGTNFTRKVRILYATPFIWNGNTASVSLPVEIPLAGNTKPTLSVKVNFDNTYTQPFIAETPISGLITNSNGNSYTLSVPPALYQNLSGLTLGFTAGVTNGSLLFAYPTGASQGIYELLLQPGAFGAGNAAPRHLTFVVDPGTTSSYNVTVNLPELLRQFRSFLHSNLKPTDSFEIFYPGSGNVISRCFNSWAAGTGGNITAAINSLASAVMSNSSTYKQLYTDAIAFNQSKPGAHTIILNGNINYLSSTPQAMDQVYNNLVNQVGPLTHKIHLINYSTSSYAGSHYYASMYLANRLTQVSGGTYHTWTTNFYNNLSRTQLYDVNVSGMLRQVMLQLSPALSAYTINLPVPGGMAYNRMDINGSNRLYSGLPYLETGKYYGNIYSGGNVELQALTPSGFISNQQPSATINATVHLNKSWNHAHITQLIAQNTTASKQEAQDSSLNNRVLCKYTAFLALEDGDTLGQPSNNNNTVPVAVPGTPARSLAASCFPNPFTGDLTVKCEAGLDALEIYDMTGRKVFSKSFSASVTSFVWNGRSSDGGTLPVGMYLVRIKSGDQTTTVKVFRQ